MIFDICVLVALRPLIEREIILFTSEFLCVCENCLQEISNDENQFDEKIEIIHDVLSEEYLSNNQFYVNYERERPYIQINGPDKYGFHGSMVINFRKYVPEEIKEVAVKNRVVELSHKAVLETGVLYAMIDPIINDLYKQNTIVNMYGSTYLTDRDVDIDILNALHTVNDYEKSSKLVDGLTHLVPILNDIELDKIVELRVKDGEAFSVYRDSITNILKENKNYTVKELKELFRDKINPELNKIEQTIKQNKKHLTGSIVKDVVFASSIISIGLYSGILPPDIGKVIAALGGTKFAYDLYSKASKLISTDEEIQKNSYYFLWKLQNVN